MLFVGDILTTGYDAVRKTDMRPGDFVAVIGCGPVGLCTVMAARALGAGKVVAVDMVPERLKLAESLGAIAVNPKEVDPDDVVLRLDGLARGRPRRGRGRARVRARRGFPARAHGRLDLAARHVRRGRGPDADRRHVAEEHHAHRRGGERAGPHGRGDRADPRRPARSEGDHLPPDAALGRGRGL